MSAKTKNIVAWVAQVLLTIAMLAGGLMKLVQPFEALQPDMPWVEDFGPTMVKLIGLLEVLGALGLNLPFLLKKFKQLVPLSAAGLMLTMIGAVATHVMRGEEYMAPLILTIIAALVTYLRKDLLSSSN